MRTCVLLLTLMVFCVTASGGPIVVYDDFSSGISGTSPWCIGGGNPGCAGIPYFFAFPFTPTTTGELTEIDLYLYPAGGAGDALVQVFADAGGLPGAAQVAPVDVPVASSGLYQAFPSTNPTLTAGTQYWLGAANSNGASGAIGWYENANGIIGPVANKASGSWVSYGTYTLAASEIWADPVPEPSTLALAALGIAGGLGLRRWTALRGFRVRR